jgi:hypothetical protein
MFFSTKRLEVEHHPRPALRIGRGPGGEGGIGDFDCTVQIGGGPEAHMRLHSAIVRVENLPLPLAGRIGGAADEMINLPHDLPWK